MKNQLKKLMQITIFPVIYWIGSFRTIKHRVLIMDAHNSQCPVSMLQIRDALIAQNVDVVEYYRDFSKLSTLKSMLISMKAVYLSAFSSVILICDNYHALDSFTSRKGTALIQVWHGAGAYKKFGYDGANHNLSERDSLKLFKYDFVPISSNYSRDCFMSAMKLEPSCFLNIGVPRTDIYFDVEEKQKITNNVYATYPQLRDKKIILWAPTFRSLDSTSIPGESDVNALSNALGDDYVVIKKLHPHLKVEDPFDAFSATEFLFVSDTLITDYSSILFDALLLNVVTILHIPDLDAYTANNGFYMKPTEMPLKTSYDEAGLLSLFINQTAPQDAQALANFKSLMLEFCDGNATKRLIDFVLERVRL